MFTYAAILTGIPPYTCLSIYLVSDAINHSFIQCTFADYVPSTRHWAHATNMHVLLAPLVLLSPPLSIHLFNSTYASKSSSNITSSINNEPFIYLVNIN